jgi:hypothetical protein
MADDLIFKVSPTVTASASPDYADADNIGGKLALPGIARRCPKGGFIVGCRIVSAVASTITFHVVFYAGDPSGTTFTDNGAFTVAAADQSKIIGRAVLDSVTDLGGCSIHSHPNLNLPFDGGREIYASITAKGALNLAATTDINLSAWVLPG